MEIKLQPDMSLSNQLLIPDFREFHIQLTSDYYINDFKIEGISFVNNLNRICIMPVTMAKYLIELLNKNTDSEKVSK